MNLKKFHNYMKALFVLKEIQTAHNIRVIERSKIVYQGYDHSMWYK